MPTLFIESTRTMTNDTRENKEFSLMDIRRISDSTGVPVPVVALITTAIEKGKRRTASRQRVQKPRSGEGR